MAEALMERYILKNDFLEIEYPANSLRITGLILTGKSNMLAELSDLPPISTSYGDFYFHGGHRLWHAPEAMPRTYIPDGKLTTTELSDGGVLLETTAEPGTGIRKQIKIHLAPDKPSLKLTHTLINDGLWAIELAPWAITQFRLGGTVILPLPIGNADPAGLLHNRQFALWPYARINDPRVKWDDEFILFKADAALPPFKIGIFNSQGWLAYLLDDVLFRKTLIADAGSVYPDNNCNIEMYCNDQFVELESLGPLTKLSPGASITHVEIWDVFYKSDTFPEEVRKAFVAL